MLHWKKKSRRQCGFREGFKKNLRFKITCLRLSDLTFEVSVASNIGSKLSRKKEKSVKREKEKQNMLVHTLMIKFGKRSFIFSKDVHIRF